MAAAVGAPDSAAPSTPPAARAAWRAVAVPTEHGGWGLTLEPVLLGLLVEPSWSGVALGVAALVLFLARTPVKVVLVDSWRGRHLPRTTLALQIAAVELAVLAGAVALAARWASGAFWVPLVAAVPLVAVELWFDMRSRSRRLAPELAGTVGIGSIAAAVVLAGGGPAWLAAAAWLVIALRAVASLPFVRLQIQRVRGRPLRPWAVDLVQLVPVVGGVAAAALGWFSWATAAALVAVGVLQLVLARVPPPRPAIVGVQQLVLGLAVVVVAGLTLG